jgi:hypothetical protein
VQRQVRRKFSDQSAGKIFAVCANNDWLPLNEVGGEAPQESV